MHSTTKALWLVATAILSLSCHRKTDRELFRDYCESLKRIPVPLSFYCGEGLEPIDPATLDTSLVNRFKPEVDDIVGRLFPEDEAVSILYGNAGDTFYPWIYTYTQEGRPIDTLYVGGICAGDVGYLAVSATRIDTDRTITICDTITTIRVDEYETEVPGSDSTFVQTARYRLEHSGHCTALEHSRTFLPKPFTRNLTAATHEP